MSSQPLRADGVQVPLALDISTVQHRRDLVPYIERLGQWQGLLARPGSPEEAEQLTARWLAEHARGR